MAIKTAINGTGRIGMIVAKIITSRDDIELVAINTTAKPDMLEYLFKYDSVHTGVDAKVIDSNTIMINGKKVTMFNTRDPGELDFGSAGAEVVIECTGVFLTTEKAQSYLKKDVTIEDINAAFDNAAAGSFKGLIEIDNDKRVSSDFIGSTYSATYVLDMTSVVDGKTVKVLAWYDNEWGYSSRLVDMCVFVGGK